MTKTLVRSVVRSLRNSFRNPPPPPAETNAYESRYEMHAQRFGGDVSVGEGDYDEIGRIELELLLMEGLKPGGTLVDLGCGNGRLAAHVIPILNSQAAYIGIDISKTYLQQGARRVDEMLPRRSCRVQWVHQTGPDFPLDEHSVDVMCTFSVFTHMENEDTYLYLKSALRVVKPGGKFIFSCLPLDLAYARRIFLEEADLPLEVRWQRVRNVVTSKDLMSDLSEMAGWKVLRWYEGEKNNIGRPGSTLRPLGQSSCVLEAP